MLQRKLLKLGQRCQKNREVSQSCVISDLAAAFCSCFILMASSLTGLGMKVMSAPSFTSRPIHQSLLYFCVRVKDTSYDARCVNINQSEYLLLLHL